MKTVPCTGYKESTTCFCVLEFDIEPGEECLVEGYVPLTAREIKSIAFSALAQLHPHAAAEADWPAFVAFFRQKADTPEAPEEYIRQLLAETDSEEHDQETLLQG